MFGRQADFFDRLREKTDFRVSDFALYCDVSESTATRKVRGQTELGLNEARLLIARHPDHRVGDAVCDYFIEGTRRTLLALPDESGPIGDETAKAMEDIAAFIRQRAEHLADGIVTPQESAEQAALVKDAARDLHRLLVAIVNQPVSIRRKAKERVLGIAREGGAA